MQNIKCTNKHSLTRHYSTSHIRIKYKTVKLLDTLSDYLSGEPAHCYLSQITRQHCKGWQISIPKRDSNFRHKHTETVLAALESQIRCTCNTIFVKSFFFVEKGPAADATDAQQPWGLLCNPVMKILSFFPFFRLMEHRWNEIDTVKVKYLSQCHFVHHKSHKDWAGIETRPPR